VHDQITDKASKALVQKELEKYCSYQNLEDVYNKVVPPVQQFSSQMVEFTRELGQMREIV
jgi:hypothetical protein